MVVARVLKPDHTQRGERFEAQRMGPTFFGAEGDPFLNLDHFRMRTPTFPPHPHAGFSAVTYLLPESAGAMLNRDGRGDRRVIGQGGVHWTASGSGLVHEEVPEPPGSLAEGLQIFIRQPVAQERAPAVVHHTDPVDVPLVAISAGSWVRVVAGVFGAFAAPFDPPSPMQILDIALAPGASLEWTTPVPDGGVSIYVFSGVLDVDGLAVAAPNLAVFARGTRTLHLAATVGDTRSVVFAGQPLDQPSVTSGPFVLSTRAAIDDAFARYRRGEMGSIAS